MTEWSSRVRVMKPCPTPFGNFPPFFEFMKFFRGYWRAVKKLVMLRTRMAFSVSVFERSPIGRSQDERELSVRLQCLSSQSLLYGSASRRRPSRYDIALPRLRRSDRDRGRAIRQLRFRKLVRTVRSACSGKTKRRGFHTDANPGTAGSSHRPFGPL